MRSTYQSLAAKAPHPYTLFYFSGILFLFSVGDAIMSYLSPVLIESHLNSTFLMGVIMSTSSMAGFLGDLIIGRLFGGRSYAFFLFWGAVIALLFPLSYLFLPPVVTVFIFAMAVWGIYYELMQFAIFSYIEHFHTPREHARAWGSISSSRGAAYIVGPALATYFLSRGDSIGLVIAVSLFGLSILGMLLFRMTFGRGHHYHNAALIREHISLVEHFQALGLILKRVWPVWLFTLCLYIVDSTYWTTGALFSEALGDGNTYGNLFMSVRMIPFMLVGLLVGFLAKPMGKKRVSFMAGFMEGVFMVFLGIFTQVPFILLAGFLSAVFAAIAIPEIMAVSEDYVTRLKGLGGLMVSLELLANSLGYVIGPMVSGYLSETLGMQKAFVLIGLFLMIVSFIMLLVTPRKIKLPQQALAQLAT